MSSGTLTASVDHFGCDHKFTALIPDLSGGVDPDDAFSSIPYEKGANFLRFLEVPTATEDIFIFIFSEDISGSILFLFSLRIDQLDTAPPHTRRVTYYT